MMWFRSDSPLIHFRVEGRAPKRHTITVQFSTDIVTDQLLMGTPGGVVSRPPQRIYSPTFWPFQHFVHLKDGDNKHGIALFQRMPGAIAYGSDCNVQIIALRNALRERAFGFIPVPGNPAKGFEKDTYHFDYCLLFTPNGDWKKNDLASIVHTIDHDPWQDTSMREITSYVNSLITTDRQDVWVIASKPANRGKGWIIRLYTLTSPGKKVTLSVNHHKVIKANLCDARERDLEPLEINDGKIHLTMPGTIGTIRVIT
jgi:alpha-mannosidase